MNFIRNVGMVTIRNILFIVLLISAITSLATPVKVKRVIDGDTFETESGDRVRLLGINAPEMSDIFGQEAKQHLIELINDKTVELHADARSSDRDRYSRLLRYIYLDGNDINKKMILDGYAFAYLKYHFERAHEYKEAQQNASSKNLGMWGDRQQEKDEHLHQPGILKQPKNCFWESLGLHHYLVAASIFILFCSGTYYYFKK